MKIQEKIILFIVFVLLSLCPIADGIWADESWKEEILCTISVSKQIVLPYESIGVLVTLRNETNEPRQVIATWDVFLSIGEEVKDEEIIWRKYTPDHEPMYEPPSPSAISLGPGESETRIAHLDYEHPGQHVFAHPGTYKIKGGLGYQGYIEEEVIEVKVVEPKGIDEKAYEFFQKNDIHKFFSEHTVEKYPYDHSTVQSMEKFITDFDGSQYSNLAQLGLSIMWMNGIENKVDLKKTVELLTELSQRTEEPMVSQAYYYLGISLCKQGHKDKAKEYYEKVLQGKPDPYIGYLVNEALRKYYPPEKKKTEIIIKGEGPLIDIIYDIKKETGVEIKWPEIFGKILEPNSELEELLFQRYCKYSFKVKVKKGDKEEMLNIAKSFLKEALTQLKLTKKIVMEEREGKLYLVPRK